MEMSTIKAYKRIKIIVKTKTCHLKRQKIILTNKCSSAIIITTDMICVVRIIYLFGIFQSRILLLFTSGRQHSFGASEWFARLINGLLSLIR